MELVCVTSVETSTWAENHNCTNNNNDHNDDLNCHILYFIPLLI